MNVFFKDLIDSVGEIFSGLRPVDDHPHSTTPKITDNRTMENVSAATPGSNERIAFKLKSYYELATEEIAKAVRAEEWGLIDDAISHYNNALRILLEAKDTRSPSYISSSEQEKVKSYHQKISKWYGQVSERLQVLSRRTAGVPSTSKV